MRIKPWRWNSYLLDQGYHTQQNFLPVHVSDQAGFLSYFLYSVFFIFVFFLKLCIACSCRSFYFQFLNVIFNFCWQIKWNEKKKKIRLYFTVLSWAVKWASSDPYLIATILFTRSKLNQTEDFFGNWSGDFLVTCSWAQTHAKNMMMMTAAQYSQQSHPNQASIQAKVVSSGDNRT